MSFLKKYSDVKNVLENRLRFQSWSNGSSSSIQYLSPTRYEIFHRSTISLHGTHCGIEGEAIYYAVGKDMCDQIRETFTVDRMTFYDDIKKLDESNLYYSKLLLDDKR